MATIEATIPGYGCDRSVEETMDEADRYASTATDASASTAAASSPGPVASTLVGWRAAVEAQSTSEMRALQLLDIDQALKPAGRNRFTVVDVTPERMTFSIFTWRPPQPVVEIDTMRPTLVYTVPRRVVR